MHPLTYQVMKSIPRLEFEQFRHMDDRERLNEVRALARDQVADDLESASPAERFGKSGRVYRPGDIWLDDDYKLWPDRTERERALEAGMEPLLDMVITAEQRIKVRLRYSAGESLEQIAKRYDVTKPAIVQQFHTIHKHLRDALLIAYGPEEVPEDATTSAPGDN